MDGAVSLYNNSGQTELIADVAGWFREGIGSSTTLGLAAGTMLTGAGDVVSITGDADQPSTVLLDPSSDVPPVGGTLVVYPSPAAPEGFIGLVTGISTSQGGRKLLSTVPTTLDAAFTELESHFHGATGPSPAGSPADASGLAGAGGPASFLPSFSVGGIGDACKLATQPLELWPPYADLTFENTSLDYDFSLRDLHLLFAFHTTPTLTFGVAVADGLSCSETIPTPFKWPIPGTPLFIDVGAKVSLSTTGAISVEATAAAPTTLGFDILGSDASNLSSVDFQGSSTMSGQAAVSFTPALTLGLKVFGRVGVETSFGMKLKAGIDTTVTPCITVTLAPTVSFAVKADLWLSTWSVTVATFDGPPALLYSSDAGCPPPLGRWTGTIRVRASASWYVIDTFSGIGTQDWTFTMGDLAEGASALPEQPCNFGYGDVAPCVRYLFHQGGTVTGSAEYTVVPSYSSCTLHDLLGASGQWQPSPTIEMVHRLDTDQWRFAPVIRAQVPDHAWSTGCQQNSSDDTSWNAEALDSTNWQAGPDMPTDIVETRTIHYTPNDGIAPSQGAYYTFRPGAVTADYTVDFDLHRVIG